MPTHHLASRRPARLLLASLAVVALGSLSACGGNDSASDAPAAADTTAAATDAATGAATDAAPDDATFAADGNAVCESLYPDINAVAQTLDPSTPETVTSDFLPLVQELQDELNALTPPEDEADAYATVLAGQQDNLDAITADPSSLFSIDSSDLDAQFDALGMTSCGSDSVSFT